MPNALLRLQAVLAMRRYRFRSMLTAVQHFILHSCLGCEADMHKKRVQGLRWKGGGRAGRNTMANRPCDNGIVIRVERSVT